MSSRHARMRAADPPEGIVGGVRGAVSPAPRTRSGREQGGICTALARSMNYFDNRLQSAAGVYQELQEFLAEHHGKQ